MLAAALVATYSPSFAQRGATVPPRRDGAAPPSRARVRARPKLAVLIVVDQMRADYVDRFKGDWTGGLKRLVTQGAWFQRAAYPYLTTVTCAGHASVGTGAFPHTHGIFQNAWWDRDSPADDQLHARTRTRTTSATASRRPAAIQRVSPRHADVRRCAALGAARARRDAVAQSAQRDHAGRPRRRRGHLAGRCGRRLGDLVGLCREPGARREVVHRRQPD